MLTILFSLALLSFSFAQTCCSSGIPIASNLGFQSKGSGMLQVSLGLEHNRLSTLFNESEALPESNRLRTTNSGLLRLAYGFTDRLNIETLIPYVSQLRVITQNNGEKNNEGGHGIGDITFIAQFDLFQRTFSTLTIGGGVKLPTGANDLRNSNGFLLVNDLQLGSNAFDFMVRGAYSVVPSFRPTSSIFANAIYLSKGVNKAYLGSEEYKFGNEIQANLGISDQILIAKSMVYPSVALRFRQAIRDHINSNQLTNTGGSWLFAKLGLGFDIFNDHRLSLNFELPLYTFVDGTQLSPDFIINVSYYKSFSLSKEKSLIIN